MVIKKISKQDHRVCRKPLDHKEQTTKPQINKGINAMYKTDILYKNYVMQ